MNTIRRTEEFSAWLGELRDIRAKARILVRIDRLELGLLGDVKSVGGKVSELRIDHGPGYRVYFTWQGREIVLLLIGGDKGSQSRDIAKAQTMVELMEVPKHGKNKDPRVRRR